MLETVNKKACNGYFLLNKKYTNNQTALLESMKIGYNYNQM